MEDSLLVSLRSYRTRPGRDPLEDFITEAFAWLLRTHPHIGASFLDHIDEKIGLPTNQRGDLSWRTQVSVEEGILDMMVQTGDRVYLFEHKTWTKAKADQLDKYVSSYEDGHEEVISILTTGARWKYESPTADDVDDPDLLWSWEEIYSFLEEESGKISESERIEDFLALLDSEGLGTRNQLTESDLRALPRYIYTLDNLYARLNQITESEENWDFAYECLSDPHGRKRPKPKWSQQTRSRSSTLHGRIAVNIYSEPEPGLRAGFIIDPKNIKTELIREGPDVAVFILLPKRDLGSRYGSVVNSQAYKELRQRMEETDTGSWTAYIRKGTEPDANPHHPIALQRPLTDVLRGTSTADEQREEIMRAFREGVKLFLDGDEMRRLRDVICKYRE